MKGAQPVSSLKAENGFRIAETRELLLAGLGNPVRHARRKSTPPAGFRLRKAGGVIDRQA